MIICKIKTNEETKVVSLEEYSLYSVNNEVVFPTETILRNNGYINGHFQLTYYLLSNWKDLKTTIYDSKLIPISFSKNKTQIRAKFENYPELTNDEDIYQFQNYYQANKTKIKLLSFSKNKVAVVQHLKYNFFKGYYVIRFSQKVDYTTQDKFSLYTMKFQPITEEYDLLPLVQYQPTSYITLREPKFFDTNLSSTWVLSQSYESLTNFTESDYNIPLSINNALETIYYDINDTSSYIHFGTYQSRLNAFARKYLDLLNISQSYVSNSKTEQLQLLLKDFNTFQRHCLLDLNLITTGSQSSIKSFANINLFNQWYESKSNIALICDENNIHALYKLLPEAILYDENNNDLIQFVNLLGDTLDEFWAGIKNLTSVNSLLETELQNFSFDYLVEILRNYGITYEQGFNIQTLNKVFFESSRLNRNNIELNHYNKILLVRLLSNIPFLLKSKGSRHCIQQLYNIFGLSEGLLRIHEFVKDSYSGENLVKITKPYYSCSLNNTMSFKNSSTAQVALIYGRFPSFTSSKYLTLNNDTISGISFEPNKPFLWILEQNDSSVKFFQYIENIYIPEANKTYLENNITTISVIGNCYIDNVKFLKEKMTNYDLYAKGTNIIDSKTNILTIFNFNSLHPNQLSNPLINANYNDSAIKIQTFDTIKYSSIFSLGNTPSKFYTISMDQSVQLPQLTKTQGIKNFPNVHFGSLYSDYYNSEFIIDYEKRFENLLDNNQYINFKKLYKYKELEDYKYLYSNYFNIFTTSYAKMVKFYENLDSSFYTILQQFIPYSLNAKYGVILDNNILTRNKIPTLELINIKPTSTPSYNIQLPINIHMHKVKNILISFGYEPNIFLNLQEAKIAQTPIIKFVGISGIKNNYGHTKMKTKLNKIWNVEGQCNKKKSCYYANLSQTKMLNYKKKSFIGSAETSSVSKQRKMIIDQDKNLTITKINL